LLQCHHIAQEGATRLGAAGSNANVANLVAAVFLATGQDAASIVESATAQLHMSPISREQLTEAQRKYLQQKNADMFGEDCADEGGVYVSMQLPSVIAATVGGGTMLATQKECLQILGCHGKVMYIGLQVSCY